MRRPSWFSEAGFESKKTGAFLLFGRSKRPDLRIVSAFRAALCWHLGEQNLLALDTRLVGRQALARVWPEIISWLNTQR